MQAVKTVNNDTIKSKMKQKKTGSLVHIPVGSVNCSGGNTAKSNQPQSHVNINL